MKCSRLRGCGGPVWVGFQIRSCNQSSIQASHLTQIIWSVRIYILDWISWLYSSCLDIKRCSSSSQTTSFMRVKGRLFWCTTVWSRCSPLAAIGAGASQFCLIPHQNTFGMLIAYLFVFNDGWLPKTRFNNFKKRRDYHHVLISVGESTWN